MTPPVVKSTARVMGETTVRYSWGRVHNHFTPALYDRFIQPHFIQHEDCRVKGLVFASKSPWVCDRRSKVSVYVFLKKGIFTQMKNSCFWLVLLFLLYEHFLHHCHCDFRLFWKWVLRCKSIIREKNHKTDMGLSHYPRARKQLFLVRETDNCCCSQLPLRNWDLRSTNPFSFTYKHMRLATTPACHALLLVWASNSFCHMLTLLNILKMLFCPARWQP